MRRRKEERKKEGIGKRGTKSKMSGEGRGFCLRKKGKCIKYGFKML